MNIKEVFEKCNDDDYVIDNFHRKWKVVKFNDKGDLTNECDLTTAWDFIANFYTLTELFELDFKKVYEIDWSKVEVDTKILVSNDDVRWYHAHFAMFKNDTIYTFIDGTTSFTCKCNIAFESWNYAKLYEEEK